MAPSISPQGLNAVALCRWLFYSVGWSTCRYSFNHFTTLVLLASAWDSSDYETLSPSHTPCSHSTPNTLDRQATSSTYPDKIVICLPVLVMHRLCLPATASSCSSPSWTASSQPFPATQRMQNNAKGKGCHAISIKSHNEQFSRRMTVRLE